MIDFTPGDGPSDDTLKRLRGMMDTAMQGMASGRIGGKGTPVVKKAGRMSACKICSMSFEPPKGEEAKITHCASCENLLKEGYSALVSPDKFAFIKSSRFAPGEIVPISEAIMARVEKLANVKPQNRKPKD